jgi:hypothetical protein
MDYHLVNEWIRWPRKAVERIYFLRNLRRLESNIVERSENKSTYHAHKALRYYDVMKLQIIGVLS